eukprot:CAMPEP_0201148052 /NCGR_PEP_ID=MMETSP0851-20130426/9561_1 /ASSEMBLY_ACC=CAM_ASM_000631 /TAXON_ID=183588 /ORGANISM="Pseudo-nitzschia fraudulenta, Strain WWA7" /LENGTH=415 /DNA_ID=CAMNT_0047424095 /DNA_START=85 /DNA_END=1329 /DNA_ORIENTATION=-
MVSNWCDACQEACNDHPTMCSVCGTTLTAPPASNTTVDVNDFSTNEDLLQEMRQASRDLRNILGSLRDQVQDLDVLTRNILQERNDGGAPQDVWDPQNGGSGPASRPTSKEALKKIPRFVLNDQSTMFRQVSLRLHTDNLATSCVLSTDPVASRSGENDSAQQMTSVSAKSDITATKNTQNFDCIPGEFGSAAECMFEAGTSLVLASPATGKGGLHAETKAQISRFNSNPANARKVVLFMRRGGGLTYVQKARIAQEAGAAAVIIANNTPTPWPYVMKDSKGESKKPGQSVSIPVAMIKESDGKEIIKQFETKKQAALLQLEQKPRKPPIPKQIILPNGKRLPVEEQPRLDPSYPQDNNDHEYRDQPDWSLSCDMKISTQSCDCPVCYEELKNSETVIQMPGCGHIFHEACALVW